MMVGKVLLRPALRDVLGHQRFRCVCQAPAIQCGIDDVGHAVEDQRLVAAHGEFLALFFELPGMDRSVRAMPDVHASVRKWRGSVSVAHSCQRRR